MFTQENINIEWLLRSFQTAWMELGFTATVTILKGGRISIESLLDWFFSLQCNLLKKSFGDIATCTSLICPRNTPIPHFHSYSLSQTWARCARNMNRWRVRKKKWTQNGSKARPTSTTEYRGWKYFPLAYPPLTHSKISHSRLALGTLWTRALPKIACTLERQFQCWKIHW